MSDGLIGDTLKELTDEIVRPRKLAWGAKVSPTFRAIVYDMARRLGIEEPNNLMAVMAFETGRTFSPSIRNAAGSGAVGLIQFMPQTAAAMGTDTAALAKLTAEAQLYWVERYFQPWAFRLKNLGDIYSAVLWPKAIGQPMSYVLFRQDDKRTPKAYIQNRGLDFNKDGQVTKEEITVRVYRMLEEGLRPENLA